MSEDFIIVIVLKSLCDWITVEIKFEKTIRFFFPS